ncbi:arsenite S-adenosylmethyltransferase [Bordetella ansorpii]|uniref:Arsenite S-adenosylmethyltransferase n=1 Tax=Bordetella ansorpii TaxID=288768 RepID=A0A157SSI3_9BORD|nr:methyltransferase domain-containing protein [Bordetella ansorpii]SAI73103.1 arsenite S-adenosylmethyltransferase [Bordetella ansorpii]
MGTPLDIHPAMAYAPQEPWPPFSESVLGWDDSFHDLMLNDRLRMHAYRDAIFEVVQRGDYVVDLGTGTGILSQWALEAGAARVTGIEMNAHMLDLARQRIANVGYADRFEAVNQISYDVHLANPADVLISEIIGNLADNENFQPILADAIARFLRPGGAILPQAVSSFLVPVAADQAHRNIAEGLVSRLNDRYDVTKLYGRPGIRSPFDIYYDCILPRDLYLSQPKRLRRYEGAWDQPATYAKSLAYTMTTNGTLTGFKGYFVAELSAHTVLDISGDDIFAGTTSDSWKHAYLPIQSPIDVQAGDTLNLAFSRRYPSGEPTGFQQVYAWAGGVYRDGTLIARFSQASGE